MLNASETDRFEKFLRMALHPNSNLQESKTALDKANSMVAGELITLMTRNVREFAQEVIGTPAVAFMQTIAKYKSEVREKEDEIRATQRRLDNLTVQKDQEIEALKRLISAPKPKMSIVVDNEDEIEDNSTSHLAEGEMSFNAWRTRVIQKLGKDWGWQTAYCEMTKRKNSDLQIYRRENRVPVDAVASLESLHVAPLKATKSWTGPEVARLKALWANGNGRHTLAQIARILSSEFGRYRSENAIKGAVDRIRRSDLTEQTKDFDPAVNAA